MNKERIARKAIERIKRDHALKVKRISERADISLLQNDIYAESLAYDLSRDLIYEAYIISMTRVLKVFETLGSSCEEFMVTCRLYHSTQISKSKRLPSGSGPNYYKVSKWEQAFQYVRHTYS